MIFSNSLLFVAGVKVTYKGVENIKDHNYLIVANHVSYMDILVMSSQFATSYVTSKEMQKTPLLGQLATLGGCLFVDRRNTTDRDKELEELRNGFNDGLNIIVFAEATTTDGRSVRPFKRGLFPSAVDTNTPVLPVTVNYLYFGNEKVCAANHEKVFWYGDMTFLVHCWNLLSLSKIDVELTVSPEIKDTSSWDFTELTNKSHEIVNSKHVPVI